MVRRSFTAVLEKNTTFTASFETEPYETGWAGEARWFVRVIALSGRLSIVPQISPDGLFWCDEGREPLPIDQPGLYSFPLRDFGCWLRLRVELSGDAPKVKVMIQLSLKEA
jgi:hypothetical protein